MATSLCAPDLAVTAAPSQVVLLLVSAILHVAVRIAFRMHSHGHLADSGDTQMDAEKHLTP